MTIFIGAITKNKKSELISLSEKLINKYKINFIDSRVSDQWNKEAGQLITKIELNIKTTKSDDNYIKKVNFDLFKILTYYLKKLKK
jgi:hypothetical protein